MTIIIFFKLLKNLDLKLKTKKKKASHEISLTTIITLVHKKEKLELSWFLSQIFKYTNCGSQLVKRYY